jgi:D-alanine-D-alanine ligase
VRILILWNFIDDDVYEHYRADDRRTVDWNPDLEIEPWDTVEEEMQLIVKSLESKGHTVSLVNIKDDFTALLGAISKHKPELVMNLVEFFHNDPEHEHHVPAMFELLEVPYTGNKPLSLSLCQRKPQAKAIMATQGVPTPKGIVIEIGSSIDVLAKVPADLKFPMIVKPAYDDASGGIDSGSVVGDRKALEARITKLHTENKMAALVEEYIEGREIHCAILGDKPLPLYEMVFKGGTDEEGKPLPRIITYRAKWDPYSRDHHAVQGKCPAEGLAPDLVKKIETVALAAYRALGCRDYARVDMRVDDQGNVFVLEVNPNPDLAESCAFAASAREGGMTYAQMICKIIDVAIERNKAPKVVSTGFDMLLDEYRAQHAVPKKTAVRSGQRGS